MNGAGMRSCSGASSLHLKEARAVRPPPAGIICPHARVGESTGPEAALVDCAPFRIGALRLAPDRSFKGSTNAGGRGGFLVLGGIAGRAAVCAREGVDGVEIGRGRFVLLPAGLGEFAVRARTGGFTGLWVREGNPGKIGGHG